MNSGKQVKAETSVISLQIQYQEHGKGQQMLSFETDKNAPLRRIFLDFCDRLDIVYSRIRFFHEGERIGELQTAQEREMEDGDVIDAFAMQLGGGYGC